MVKGFEKKNRFLKDLPLQPALALQKVVLYNTQSIHESQTKWSWFA